MLEAEKIKSNWEQFNLLIDQHFPTRAKELHNMYADFEDRIALMPASSMAHFHNAFAGGYIDHVLRVIKCAGILYDTWKATGADMSGYTREELMFAAMHHDLGKAGFPNDGGEVYIFNDSEWHRKNQGKMYKYNPNNPFSMVPDLGLWVLQNFKVPVTWNEYQAIRIHDGLYDDANKPYYISRSADSKLRTNLPVILHHADMMAARIEYEQWRDNAPAKSTTKKKASGPKPSINANKLFEDLFGE